MNANGLYNGLEGYIVPGTNSGVGNGIFAGVQGEVYNKKFLLDRFPNAAVAFSLRKLNSFYNGAAIRVRRSSDNATLDIGFNVVGELDIPTLTTFIGSNSGFVTTWYDQSGNSRNATQINTAQQPRIINSGILDTRNNKPCLFFDGTNDNFETTYTDLDLSVEFMSVFLVVTPSVVNKFMDIVSKFDRTGVVTTEDGWEIRISNTSKFGFSGVKDGDNGNAPVITSTDNMVANTQYLFHVYAPAGGLTGGTNLYRNNNILTDTRLGGAGISLDNTAYPIEIGKTSFSGADYYFWDGSMQEIILYNKNLNNSQNYNAGGAVFEDTNRTGISNNINNYYKIY